MYPKHITNYETESYKGFRVAIQKKGILFVKYFSKLGRTDQEALNDAIAYEAALSTRLTTCSTVEDIIKLKNEF